MNIFMCFYFRAARLEREKRENKCSAKISTFTVFWNSDGLTKLFDWRNMKINLAYVGWLFYFNFTTILIKNTLFVYFSFYLT